MSAPDEDLERQLERGREQTRERIERTGDPFLGAAVDDEEEW